MMDFLLKLWKKLPFGKNIKLFLMRFLQDEFLIGVTGVIFDDQGKILVVKHSYRDGEYWSLPGGFIKGREHPMEGLAREIEEETGFIVKPEENLRVRTDRDTARLDFSLTGKLTGGEFMPSKEVTEARFYSPENLPLLPPDQLLLIQAIITRNSGSPK